MNGAGLTSLKNQFWCLDYKKHQFLREFPVDLSSDKFEPSNLMEEETTGAPGPWEYELGTSLVEASSLKKSKLVTSRSKDSLKLCRRLAPAFLKLIQTKGDIFVEGFLASTVGILAKQAEILKASIVNQEDLKLFILARIESVWRSFARQLCCSQNNKISKIKKKGWDAVFTCDGFWEVFGENDIDFSSKFVSNETYALHVMCKLLKKMIFFTNRAMVLTFLFLLKSQDWKFRENIESFENYLVLSLAPELFDFYNHKRGVFVDQCCQACKVCQSKFVNETVYMTIQRAQQSAEELKSFLFSMQLSPEAEEAFDPLGIF